MHATMAMQHRQQHRQPVLIQAHSNASRISPLGHIHQRLNLHQHRPSAFPDHHHHAAGSCLLAAVQEDGTGVLHFLQALFQHRKHAQFVNRAKAVLDAPQGAVTAIAGAFQQDGAVDHMLQYFRPSQAAILGNVAHQE